MPTAEYSRKWRAAHPESTRASQQKHRAKRKANETPEQREKRLVYLRVWQAKNTEKIKADRKARVNTQEYRDERRAYYAANVERMRAGKKRYSEKNKEMLRIKSSEHYRKNKAEFIRAVGRYIRNRKETDPVFRLVQNIRARISVAIREASTQKAAKSIELLGCTGAEARVYIEKQFRPGMTWENHGIRGWHIDHIRPVVSFDLTTMEGQKAAFNYTNLQPLWYWENLAKGDKIAA